MEGRFEFIWSLWHRVLMVISQRVRFVFNIDGKCYMCSCGVLETIAHRFWVSATLQRDHLWHEAIRLDPKSSSVNLLRVRMWACKWSRVKHQVNQMKPLTSYFLIFVDLRIHMINGKHTFDKCTMIRIEKVKCYLSWIICKCPTQP